MALRYVHLIYFVMITFNLVGAKIRQVLKSEGYSN